ncbi:hypothetical protein C100_23730 [Sphingobium sp. C100]|jgi:hypothetical protein|uniref:hypothetical protein n=1 Tax=Sphingobium sp. C100 TaxID=1207055 RepID=UPI0003D643D9|nr:hypothetical protein [Sphingobium sp. C100]ETI58473.1 hypothetical protein C100_23730 [Sphingobium sp. C100]PHQ63163.1 MAG: hypothetical protein COC10_07615 [Sphingobium sp.]
MTPIERAARALCRFHGEPEEGDGWQAYLPQVRAVLDALHEPSEYMKEAGAGITRYVSPDSDDRAYGQDAANVWRYMIDAMIKQVR